MQGGVRMKKIKNLLLVLTIMALFPIGVFAKDKINVYIFKREGCQYCANALTFFNSLLEDEEFKNYFNLVAKDVVKNKSDSELMEKVGESFGDEIKGVPYIVIGDQTFKGYASTYDDSIKEAIKTSYESDSYKDYVAPFIEGNADDSNGAAITVIVLLIAVAGVVFLVYMAKEDNTTEEPKKEIMTEKKETVKTTPKKAATKKKTSTTKQKTSTKK